MNSLTEPSPRRCDAQFGREIRGSLIGSCVRRISGAFDTDRAGGPYQCSQAECRHRERTGLRKSREPGAGPAPAIGDYLILTLSRIFVAPLRSVPSAVNAVTYLPIGRKELRVSPAFDASKRRLLHGTHPQKTGCVRCCARRPRPAPLRGGPDDRSERIARRGAEGPRHCSVAFTSWLTDAIRCRRDGRLLMQLAQVNFRPSG